jgi:hypothetical protein
MGPHPDRCIYDRHPRESSPGMLFSFQFTMAMDFFVRISLFFFFFICISSCLYIEPGSTISSDAYRSYNALAEEFDHQPIKFNVKDNPGHLKWLHTMISNAKAFIGGTFHELDSKHLQSYLNEFCFRTNRRQFGGQMFNRLLTACISTDTITYGDLTANV